MKHKEIQKRKTWQSKLILFKFANPKSYGLDLWDGKVRDNLKAGVLEPALTKIKSIRFATEAAITILRIDDKIKVTFFKS
jgi:chaperonin GroEL (HSP60 family)